MWDLVKSNILELARSTKNLRWTHAAVNAAHRLDISQAWVNEILRTDFKVLAAEPGNRFRIWLGYQDDGGPPFHAIVALDLSNYLVHIITLQRPDASVWGPTGRERRR